MLQVAGYKNKGAYLPVFGNGHACLVKTFTLNILFTCG